MTRSEQDANLALVQPAQRHAWLEPSRLPRRLPLLQRIMRRILGLS